MSKNTKKPDFFERKHYFKMQLFAVLIQLSLYIPLLWYDQAMIILPAQRLKLWRFTLTTAMATPRTKSYVFARISTIITFRNKVNLFLCASHRKITFNIINYSFTVCKVLAVLHWLQQMLFSLIHQIQCCKELPLTRLAPNRSLRRRNMVV